MQLPFAALVEQELPSFLAVFLQVRELSSVHVHVLFGRRTPVPSSLRPMRGGPSSSRGGHLSRSGHNRGRGACVTQCMHADWLGPASLECHFRMRSHL